MTLLNATWTGHADESKKRYEVRIVLVVVTTYETKNQRGEGTRI
jgi:hypothetical protein